MCACHKQAPGCSPGYRRRAKAQRTSKSSARRMAAPADWALKGAGNANLVFSYHGEDQNLVGVVLRVRKVTPGGAQEGPPSPRGNTVQGSQAIDAAIWHDILPEYPVDGDTSHREEVYTLNYLTQWVDAKYIPRGVPCDSPQDVIQSLKAKGVALDPAVPVHLFMDHTLITYGTPEGWEATGPTLCAEIKPKAGCMPPTTYMSGPHTAIKAKYPRYILHALLKTVQGKGELNGYNPLDLFSGDSTRMNTALEALVTAPNNNLRLFLDGALLWGASATTKAHHGHKDANSQPTLLDPATTAQRLSELEAKLTAAGFATAGVSKPAAGDSAQGAGGTAHVRTLVQTLQEVLRAEEVLSQVKAVQSQDQVDVEGAVAVLNLLQQKGTDTPTNPTDGNPAVAALAAKTRDELMSLLRGYLTAATCKDCGIMVALQQVRPQAGASHPHDAPSPAPSGQLSASLSAVLSSAGASMTRAQSAAQPRQLARDASDTLKAIQNQAVGVVKAPFGTDTVHFLYKITLLDLDLKSVAKIPVHAALDREIVECAAQHLDLLQQLNIN